jgi:hypothetical protein
VKREGPESTSWVRCPSDCETEPALDVLGEYEGPDTHTPEAPDPEHDAPRCIFYFGEGVDEGLCFGVEVHRAMS